MQNNTYIGPYCELMKKDAERINELVRNTRKYFSEDKLEILDIKLDLDMPLCEIIFEGFINEIFRPFYARGSILQDEIVERFRVECPVIEKDIRLDAKYGGRYAPGLLPKWDTQGMLEEIVEAMDRPPDWAAVSTHCTDLEILSCELQKVTTFLQTI